MVDQLWCDFGKYSIIQLSKPPSDNKITTMIQVQILLNDARDIESYDAVVVAGIYSTYMLDKGDEDLQTFWNNDK